MFDVRGSRWGPPPLPDFLLDQLEAHGFSTGDAGRCARLINERAGSAAVTSLFVDLGSCKFLEADVDGAMAAWRHAIVSDHDAAAARAMLNLGLLYEHLQLHDQAIGLLARVAERNVEPYVYSAAMASARCQVAIGHADRGMETMARLAQRVMVHHPDSPEFIQALYGLGEVAENAGRLDRAERSWRVAAASPTSPIQRAATERLVQLLVRRGHSHHALDILNRLDLDDQANVSSAAPMLLDAAELFIRTNDQARAIEVLTALQGMVDDPVERFRLVDANLRCGRANEAIDELEVLLGDPDEQIQWRSLVSLGRVYATYDMIDPAVSMYQRAVASDDAYWMPVASLALGDVLAERGDLDAARQYWSYAAEGAVPASAEQARARLEAAAPTQAEHDPTMAAIPDVGTERERPASDSPPILAAEATAQHAAAERDTSEPAPVASTDDPAVGAGDATEAAELMQVDTSASTIPAEPAMPEPKMILLDPDAVELDPDGLNADAVVIALDDASGEPDQDVVAEAPPATEVVAPAARAQPDPTPASAFANHLAEPDEPRPHNPYAALAPDVGHDDVAPTLRNPYAELAPNYADDEFAPPPDVAPGDWESMLDDWPVEPLNKPKRRSSAFSRYT